VLKLEIKISLEELVLFVGNRKGKYNLIKKSTYKILHTMIRIYDGIDIYLEVSRMFRYLPRVISFDSSRPRL
jgi:hypothetical protein